MMLCDVSEVWKYCKYGNGQETFIGGSRLGLVKTSPIGCHVFVERSDSDLKRGCVVTISSLSASVS